METPVQFADAAIRFWDEIVSRSSGPMAFRFYFQPAMAILLAVRDGYKDALGNRAPYLWTILRDPSSRRRSLAEGVRAVGRVLLIGVGMDAAYQILVIKAFRPLEMLVVVVMLAFIPYLLARGPAARAVRWWHARQGGNQDEHTVHDGKR